MRDYLFLVYVLLGFPFILAAFIVRMIGGWLVGGWRMGNDLLDWMAK